MVWMMRAFAPEDCASANAVTTPAWSLQCPRKGPLFTDLWHHSSCWPSSRILYIATMTPYSLGWLLQVLDLLHNLFHVKTERTASWPFLIDKWGGFISGALICGWRIKQLWCSEGESLEQVAIWAKLDVSAAVTMLQKVTAVFAFFWVCEVCLISHQYHLPCF